MKLIIIRHGDPDYVHDTLTEKGWKEAEYLSERIAKLNVDEFYVSPLGRAKATASLTLKKMNREAEVLDWLHEFTGQTNHPDKRVNKMAWDQLPSLWADDKKYYDRDEWLTAPLMTYGDVKEKYDYVGLKLNEFLTDHGYQKNGGSYKVLKANSDTIVFFCHFAIECVIMSHIMNVSPFPLWHNFVALPSSVTTLVTEEREQGTAIFRCCGFGDISHLYAAGEPASPAATFCEKFTDDFRH